MGTTGRVLDHIERGNIDFSQVKTVVLDEADVMLKMGFKEDVEKVYNGIIINMGYRYWVRFRNNAKTKSKFVYFPPQFLDGFSMSQMFL